MSGPHTEGGPSPVDPSARLVDEVRRAALGEAAWIVWRSRSIRDATAALVRAGAADPTRHGPLPACPRPDCVAGPGEVCTEVNGARVWASHPERLR